MNSFRRNDLLKKSVEHFSSCDCVGQIQVVWSDQQNAPPGLSMFSEGARRKVLFEVHDTDSLNHRFNITVPIATDGVFSVDDDLKISCEDLRFGFDTWRSSQTTMVGFTPRLATHDPETSLFSYRSWRVARWNGVYNIILTKCCFLHRDHLRTYVEKMPRSLLAYIDHHRNCEDLAMSLLVAKYYNTPPLWVSGGVKEIGGDGISSSSSHTIARGKCLDVFARELGGMPLLDTSARVYPMRSRLFSWL